MAALPPKAAARATRTASDRYLPVAVVAVVIVLVGLPAALATGAKWVEWADPSKAEGVAPSWLPTETVRATTLDGDVIKAKVALDAPDADTRSWIKGHPQQVTLAMQIGVSEHDDDGTEGAERVQRLSDHIQARLNHHLVANQVPPVREVLIQDLVITKP